MLWVSLMGGAEQSLLPLHVCLVEKPVDGSIVGVVDAVGEHGCQWRMVRTGAARRACIFVHRVMGVDPYPEVVYLL